MVKIDGSGRATLRNRRFLKPINPYLNQATEENPQQELNDQDQSTDSIIEQKDPNQLLNIPNPSSNDTRENSPEVGGEEETRRPVRQRKANIKLASYEHDNVFGHMWERR